MYQSLIRFLPLLWAVILAKAAVTQVPATIEQQLTTPERIDRTKFWPTDGRAKRDHYLGSKACTLCHNLLVQGQLQHSMAKTSVHAENSRILADHAGAEFHIGDYDYKIEPEQNGSFEYALSSRTTKISAQIDWAFGAAKVGQSYLSAEKGTFREVRFSYFSTLHSFDVTPNQSMENASTVDKATGRLLSHEEAQRCFGCHTTASSSGKEFEPANAIPGVSCEACHGAGSQHVAAMRIGDLAAGRAAIFNPGQLKPVELLDFCGACHTTWWDAKRISATGVATIRFHPYRLEGSRCWGNGDKRLTCISCHNPHQPLVREARAYDARCLACHLNSKDTKAAENHPGSACPIATQDCITCHMPKYEVPDMHYKYTDHRIRIVKTREPFPE